MFNGTYTDASLANMEMSKTQGGRIVGLEDGHLAAGIICRSGALKRVAHSSFDGETIIAVDGASDGIGVTILLEELRNGPRSSLIFTKKILSGEVLSMFCLKNHYRAYY